MPSLAVAPCPNWNHPGAVSGRESDGIYASACFKNVVIYQLQKEEERTNLKLLNIIFHPYLRIVNVAVYPVEGDDAFGQTIAIVGETGSLSVTNMLTGEALFQYHPDKSSTSNGLSSVCWCIVDGEAMVSAVGGDCLVVWCPKYSATNSYPFPGRNLNLIKTVPRKPDEAVIAAGHHILHVSLKSGTIMRQFKGHTNSVYFIAFKNDDDLSFASGGTDDTPIVFASSDYDRDVMLWDFSNLTYLERKKVENSAYRKHVKDKETKFHICLSWKEDQLLTSTPTGQILQWQEGCVKPTILSHEHKKVIYNLVSVKDVLISCGQDRQIVGVSKDTGKALFQMATQGVCFSSMAFSPQDATRLALGTQDGCIDLLSYKEGRYVKSQIDRQHGKIKIFSLAWHPTSESKLLFGTSEGQVGVCNVFSRSTSIFAHHHKHSTYTVHWAPVPSCLKPEKEEEVHDFYPYSFGDKEILIRNESRISERKPPNLIEFAKLDGGMNTQVPTDFSFSSSYEMVAIGFKNGCIVVLELDSLEKRFVISAIHKTIQHLLWKPDAEESSEYTLAVGSGDQNIHIFNLDTDSDEDCVEITRASKELSGHTLRVVWLAWSPYEDGILASASYDSFVQLWNTKTGEPLCCYGGHSQRVFRVEFAPFDSDLMLSFSEENSIHQWRPSEMEARTQKDLGSRYRKAKGSRGKRFDTGEESSEKPVDAKKPTSTKTHFPLFHTLNSNKKHFHQLCVLTYMEKIRQNHDKSEDVSDVEDQLEKVNIEDEDLTKYFQTTVEKYGKLFKEDLEMPNPIDASSFMKYFGDFQEFDEALLEECVANEKLKQTENSYEIHCWRGSIQEKIKWAITNKKVDPYVISLAPQVSFSLWEQCCEAYADQLVETQEFAVAATYLVSSGKTEKAVDILIAARQYKEAFSIAKCRLGFDSDVISKIATAWADSATRDGTFNLATLLYLNIGDMEMAAKTMCRRKEHISLTIGGELYKLIGNDKMANAMFSCALKDASIKHLFDAVDELMNLNNELKWFKPIHISHKAVYAAQKESPLNLLSRRIISDETNPTMMQEVIDEWDENEIDSSTYEDILTSCSGLNLCQFPKTSQQLMFDTALVWTRMKLEEDDEERQENLLSTLCNTLSIYNSPEDSYVATHFPCDIDDLPFIYKGIDSLEAYDSFLFAYHYSEMQVLSKIEEIPEQRDLFHDHMMSLIQTIEDHDENLIYDELTNEPRRPSYLPASLNQTLVKAYALLDKWKA